LCLFGWTLGRDLLFLDTADVDLEVHVPFAQRLGVGDHPILAFEGEASPPLTAREFSKAPAAMSAARLGLELGRVDH
jgi:hypothetical protein